MIDFEPEARAAAESLLVHSRPELGAIAVTGPDRVTWLNGLVTCELAKAKPGDGAYGLAVGKTGKVLAELWIVLGETRLVVGVARDRVAGLIEHLERYLIMENAEIAEASSELGWIFGHGPRAGEALELARAAGAEAARVDWTGRHDAVVVAAPKAAEDAITAAMLALPGAGRARDDAWEALRVAWGLPRLGVDFGEDNSPHEASLDKLAVSFNKGCYLGQEAVFMLEARGHAKKHLARVEVPGGADVAPGTPVTLPDGTEVGEVTSAVATGQGAIALAYVKHKHALPDAELRVAGREARLVDLAARPR
jgi:tRNA-modifying protein YgfZ